MYLILRQTFFPEGSSVCEEDSEQQSRALRALRRSFISTNSETKTRNQVSLRLTSLCPVFFFPLSTRSPSSQRAHNERQYLSFCLPSTLPSFSPSCESSCGSGAAREVEAPGFPLPISWGSQSHFLLFSQTQSFLKMVEH